MTGRKPRDDSLTETYMNDLSILYQGDLSCMYIDLCSAGDTAAHRSTTDTDKALPGLPRLPQACSDGPPGRHKECIRLPIRDERAARGKLTKATTAAPPFLQLGRPRAALGRTPAITFRQCSESAPRLLSLTVAPGCVAPTAGCALPDLQPVRISTLSRYPPRSLPDFLPWNLRRCGVQI